VPCVAGGRGGDLVDHQSVLGPWRRGGRGSHAVKKRYCTERGARITGCGSRRRKGKRGLGQRDAKTSHDPGGKDSVISTGRPQEWGKKIPNKRAEVLRNRRAVRPKPSPGIPRMEIRLLDSPEEFYLPRGPLGKGEKKSQGKTHKKGKTRMNPVVKKKKKIPSEKKEHLLRPLKEQKLGQ